MSQFDSQSTYSIHQVDCDCEDKSNCSCDTKCGCCPPGLVAVQGCDGDVSCLTPNDAACLEIESHIPSEGLVKLFHPTTLVYLGDVTPEQAIDFMAAIDTNITPIAQGTEYTIQTQDAVALAAPPDTETRSTAVDFIIDRISCEDVVAITFATPIPGVSFLGGAATLNIPAGSSNIMDGIEITDVIDAGNINVTLQYDGCGNAKTKIITLNVT